MYLQLMKMKTAFRRSKTEFHFGDVDFEKSVRYPNENAEKTVGWMCDPG
jgi:hypothetical protein